MVRRRPNGEVHHAFSLFSIPSPTHPPPTATLTLHFTRKRFLGDRLVSSFVLRSLRDDVDPPGIGLIHPTFSPDQVDVAASSTSDSTQTSLWHQMKEIVVFAGPATGLWICGPLMSLIDTAFIGQGSSLEVAALVGPQVLAVFCDYTSYLFMFLSIATSNLVATSLATQDKEHVQHRISVLLFVGLACGFFMFFLAWLFGSSALAAFTGPKNVHLLPAANTYVQIRGLAWPAVLIGWVAQSASLGMKDSWGPLKALVVASIVNGVGDIVLCRVMSYGIAGAAWATMASQVIASYMMLAALKSKGYNAFSVSMPTLDELLRIVGLAALVFITMMSKVAFVTLLIYFATSMGTVTLAAHQVMLQSFYMCTVWG
ncbi:hypothetical protein MLD38_032059 [Melastoma candidum]|uniref:Uncharacterized protein n=1 Tax=Melastoma candidum TaxID=119954 RepID=A0ACB9M2L8_9MYRT|nr:hypothetical protein MLD38_032059 [Melastoma candidum]